MKQRLPSQGLFLDSDLLDIFNSIFMEDSIPCRKFDVTSMAESVYRHFYSTMLRITDTADKCMVLQEFSGQAQLVALYLQGANAQREVKLNMALYTSQPFSRSTSKQPVTLGIVGRNFYLSCVMVGGQPELRLEKVDKLLSPIKRELLRFLFFKVGSNPSSSFESAACPGWYISTSQKNNELVTVTTMQEQTAIQNFKLVHMQ
uniref:Interleukin-1 n=1 Tax=Andrias davidianus TaxID=141262 RepID=A0A6B7FQB2_ANDDA|nr:IL-1beta [Andrias davidianus]